MRVADEIVGERRKRLAVLLDTKQYLPLSEICRLLGVSEATARRDLAWLESEKKIRRTFGGAVAFFNQRFPSFRQRLTRNYRAKRIIAKKAREEITDGQRIYLDSGTTVFFLAEELAAAPPERLTVVTGNLPVAELLSEAPGIDVHLTGGQVVVRQSVLLGPACRAVIDLWRFDAAFLSAEGADIEGLWNSQEEIVLTQRRAMERSGKTFLLIDSSKLGKKAPALLCGWKPENVLLTDAGRVLRANKGIPSDAGPCLGD